MNRTWNRTLRTLASALLVCAVAACQSNEQKVQDLMERAEAASEAGKHTEALINLKTALQLAPQSGEVNLRLARTMILMKQPQNALFFFEEAFRLDPSLDEARLGAARILSTSDVPRAEELLRQLLERDPTNAHAVAARANLELVKQDVPAALESALLATQLAPDDHVAWVQLGRVYQAQVQLAMRKGEVPPDEVYAAAVAAFDKAGATTRKDAEGLETMIAFERARLLAAWPRHTTEAKDAYLALLKSTHEAKDPKLYQSARAVALYFAAAVGDPAIAREVLEALVALDPSYIWAWTLLATVEEDQGGSAAAVYDRLVKERPKDAKAQIARADDLRHQGRGEDAVRDLLARISQVDDPDRLRGYVVDVLDELGRKDEASSMLAQLERDAPEGTPTRIAQATRALREDRPGDAVKILEPMLATTTESGVALVLAEAQLRVRNVPAATAALDRAFALSGGVLPEGLRVRFSIARADKDWNAVLRIADEMARASTKLSVGQELSVAEALYEVAREPEGRARLEAIVARGNLTARTRAVYVQREGERNPARARQLLEEGLALQPQSLELLRALTTLDLRENRTAAAMARLDAAIEAREAGGDVGYLRLLRGRLRLAAGDEAGAQADALAAFSAAPQRPDTAQLLAEVAMRRGEVGEAIVALEEADRRSQLPRPSRTVLARLYGASGRDEDAIRMLEAIVADGGGPIPKNELAFLLAKHGRDLDRAMTLAKEVVAADATQSAYLDTLGFAYLQRKLYGPALAQFDRAIELANDEKQPRPDYHYRRGLALQALERKDEARKEFETALSLDPGFADAQHARASLDERSTATP